MRDVIRHPKHLPLIAPSILSADFARMGEECAGVLDGGADILHLDVMDGHFVPNLTMGPDMCRALRQTFPDVCLDVHLMIEQPDEHVERFVEAGADHVTFHIEVCDDDEARRLADRVRSLGATSGIAINPPTDVGRVLPVVESFDMVLVMSVNPGFSGQAFIEESLEKTRAIAPRLRDDQRLEMDGGIGTGNAEMVREAGCDVLVAASAIFGVNPGARSGVIQKLRGAAQNA